MSNEIAAIPANVTAIVQNIRANISANVSGAGQQYIKFGKTGEWEMGRDAEEVNGTWAVNPHEAAQGWVCWDKDRKKRTMLREELTPIMKGSPSAQSELEDLGGEWSAVCSMSLKCVEGEHKDVQAVWKGSSHGARNEFARVLGLVADRLDEGNVFYVPLVTFGCSHYVHNEYGKIFTPVLEIVGWTDMNGNPEAEERRSKKLK